MGASLDIMLCSEETLYSWPYTCTHGMACTSGSGYMVQHLGADLGTKVAHVDQ
jgi:hypothetical protein